MKTVKFIASCGSDGYTSSLYKENSQYKLTALIGNREEFEAYFNDLPTAMNEMVTMFEEYVVKNCGDDEEDFLSGMCGIDAHQECESCS